ILLAVLIVLGVMNRNNEIVALRSGGISVFFLLRPIVALGCVVGVCLFFLSEVIVPITVAKANRIWTQEVRKKTVITSKRKNIWARGKRAIYHIKYYEPDKRTVHGVTLNYFDQNFNLVRRVDARTGVYKEGRWFFQEIMAQQRTPRGEYRTTLLESGSERLDLTPEDLQEGVKKSEEMSFTDLLDYIREVEAEGYDARRYRVDLHKKIAFPFICVIMSALGTSIAIRRKSKENISVSVAAGLVIIFSYWALFSFCISLGHGDMLPPLIAAWAVNLIFACIAAFTLLNVD
ncbi:MAG: LPS export ABC transporter permease LptG, partial [Desulfobacterales bacterium]|nr:LPS export ABC transporter permease LptG [Desulfobacterales bacterium]